MQASAHDALARLMQEVHQAAASEGLQRKGQDEENKADNGQLKWWRSCGDIVQSQGQGYRRRLFAVFPDGNIGCSHQPPFSCFW
jgi:hypothetical protein